MTMHWVPCKEHQHLDSPFETSLVPSLAAMPDETTLENVAFEVSDQSIYLSAMLYYNGEQYSIASSGKVYGFITDALSDTTLSEIIQLLEQHGLFININVVRPLILLTHKSIPTYASSIRGGCLTWEETP